MPFDLISAVVAAITVISGTTLFLQGRLTRSVILLAMAAVGSSLIFLYLGQTLVALLQLLVFVGGLSTYLIVAIAAEEKRASMRSGVAFAVAAVLISAGLLLALAGLPEAQPLGNSFSAAAETAFSSSYGLLFVSAFLLFATAIGSVVVIKRFAKLVV
ncbi:MAG: NADH-quinone oxidoreductase subunit J [Candidatus Marsarchaeota archaeon]|nr:NADH-quinone oxidoreductase subunit J [Candidatus Marsarchaeota archaeon]